MYLTVGGWTMVSRVLGFARDMLIAAMLGAGPIADAFFVALKLPNLFRRLFGEGAFNAAFVPAFSGMLTAEGPDTARRFAEQAFSVMVVSLGVLTVVGEIFMPQLITVLAPGFVAIPAKFKLAVMLSRITFPYLVLICLAALVAGMLNGLDRFTAASASYVLFNVVSIASLLWLTPYVPTAGHALAWGITASGVGQLGLLLWAVRRAGMAIRIPRPRLTPQIRLLLRRMAPGLVGAGVTQLNLAIDVIIASLLPAGTVSLLYYADRVQQLPLGVIGTAVGTALLPMLSRQVRAGEGPAALATLNRAIEYALFLTLPAAAALIISAYPVMWALFGRGAFSAHSALLSSQALAAYAIGLPAFVLVKVLAPGFFARGDTATPVKIGVAAVVLNLAMNLAFMVPLQQVGPALATSLAAIFNMGLLGAVLIRRGHLRTTGDLLQRVGRMLAATLVMSLALWAAQHALFAAPLHGMLRLAALGALVGTGLVVYGVAALAVRRGGPRADRAVADPPLGPGPRAIALAEYAGLRVRRLRNRAGLDALHQVADLQRFDAELLQSDRAWRIGKSRDDLVACRVPFPRLQVEPRLAHRAAPEQRHIDLGPHRAGETVQQIGVPGANLGRPVPDACGIRVGPALDRMHQDQLDPASDGVQLADAHVLDLLRHMRKIELVRQVAPAGEASQRRCLLFGPGIDILVVQARPAHRTSSPGNMAPDLRRRNRAIAAGWASRGGAR